MPAARNVYLSIVNSLHNTELHLMESNLDHGAWNVPPPQVIGVYNGKPGSNEGSWSSQSDGILTGTQGWVRYAPFRNGQIVDVPLGDSKDIYIEWDNPYLGSDSYQCSAALPYVIGMIGANIPTNTGDDDTLNFEVTGFESPPAYQGSEPHPYIPTCAPGYVWRDGSGPGKGDYVCVTPEARQQAADENAASAENKGKPGYRTRDAFPGDDVWVTEEQYQTAQTQNSESPQHTL